MIAHDSFCGVDISNFPLSELFPVLVGRPDPCFLASITVLDILLFSLVFACGNRGS
jgi:hypothetical protein